jgi:L-lactate dehydrogenase
MKLAIIGTGAVGSATAKAIIVGERARELVLLDQNRARAKAVATDMSYGAPLSRLTTVREGDYAAIQGSSLVIIAAGINEKAGGATDRNDPSGRLRLLDTNVEIFRDIVPRLIEAAPAATILIATNPPEPLVEVTRRLCGHERVMSTSTYIDSLRFRVHLADFFGVDAKSVQADVVAEHGTFSVFLWSSAIIGGVPLSYLLERRGVSFGEFRKSIEEKVRFANIQIIEGLGASQYGIGMIAARTAEIILRDERSIIPAGSHNARYGVTLSMPSIVGASGVIDVVWPEMSQEELDGVERSAKRLESVTRRYLLTEARSHR